MTFRILLLLAAVQFLALTGCRPADSKPTYRVRGHVQAEDGRRPAFGVVECTSLDGGEVASGIIGPDGSFQLGTYRADDGAVAGRHRVIIVQLINTEHVPLEQHHHEFDVHPRYGNYETSGLEFTVESHHDNYWTIVADEAPKQR